MPYWHRRQRPCSPVIGIRSTAFAARGDSALTRMPAGAVRARADRRTLPGLAPSVGAAPGARILPGLAPGVSAAQPEASALLHGSR